MTHIKIETREDVLILKASGTLIGSSEWVSPDIEALREAVQTALNDGRRRLVIDLKGVKTINSTGVGELVSLYTTVTNRGGHLALANLPTKIKDILEVTQLITVFDEFDSPAEAAEFLRTKPLRSL